MKNYLKIKHILVVLFLTTALISCEKEIAENEPDTLSLVANLQSEVEDVDYVTLKGNNGKYVSSENGRKPIRCNRDKVGPWEVFELVYLGNRKYALKGSNGKYVSSENGFRAMTCNRNKVGSWESFFIGYLGGGVFLRQNNDRWTNSANYLVGIENGTNRMTCTERPLRDTTNDNEVIEEVIFEINYLE